MESINSFIKETEFDLKLQDAYKECWSRLIRAVPNLSNEDFSHLSNPFLIKCLPAYKKAKKKVLFVGQETNGWESFRVTLETFHGGNQESNRDDIINYLQWMYEDLRFHRKWDYTPFWKGMRRLYQAIDANGIDDGFLHTELVRFDLNQKRLPQDVEDLLQKEYNVLPMEIKALDPDIVIFLTGPDYDDRLRETFINSYVLGDHLKFELINGFKKNELIRLIHPVLPYHTYRTYHPGYSLRKENEVFIPIEKTIINLINNETNK
ncbi:hypothetical protein [Neobacillus citreus]|uniref:Uracil-DNA glycosylase n=1 Tax=Neobacillus citreus TaxID=2833578 RepID=A0A942TA33_9BACI|nr:hypothetical protein [Neobacillus citreus]MCH6265074.1 hypothetical protein [Neobacillus citreus]